MSYLLVCLTYLSSTLDVFSADKVTAQVHDLGNRRVGHDVGHPQVVVQRSLVAAIAKVVSQSGAGVVHPVSLKVTYQGDVADSNLSQARAVNLLPLPPETVQVRVVQEKQGLTRAANNVKHLPRLSQYVVTCCSAKGGTYGSTNCKVARGVRADFVALRSCREVIGSEALVDVLLLAGLEAVGIERAGQAIVGRLGGGIDVESQVDKGAVRHASTVAAVTTEAGVGIKDNGGVERIHVKDLVPVRLATLIATLGLEKIFMHTHKVAMPGEE